jgi:hypothetical protein
MAGDRGLLAVELTLVFSDGDALEWRDLAERRGLESIRSLLRVLLREEADRVFRPSVPVVRTGPFIDPGLRGGGTR